MRLNPKEISSFVQVLDSFLNGMQAQLYLFGSRTDDKARGGDIDLLLLVDEAHLASIKSKKTHFLVEFKKHVGDCRIDLTIATLKESQKDPFLSSILPKAVCLKEWEKLNKP